MAARGKGKHPGNDSREEGGASQGARCCRYEGSPGREGGAAPAVTFRGPWGKARRKVHLTPAGQVL